MIQKKHFNHILSLSVLCFCTFYFGIHFDAAVASDETSERLQIIHTGRPQLEQTKVPTRFGLALMGGGGEKLEPAFRWLSERAKGGNVVVLRVYSKDRYVWNDFLMNQIGSFNSVTTVALSRREDAYQPEVIKIVKNAHLIFIAGGDQYNYHRMIRNTPLHEVLLTHASERKIPMGGSSAGCAILGQYYFSSKNDTIISDEALKDPYSRKITIEANFFHWSELRNVITDTHFANRNRLGRLAVFMARIREQFQIPIKGIGVDEDTALVIDEQGQSQVLGEGSVYEVELPKRGVHLQAGQKFSVTKLSVKKRSKTGDQQYFLNIPDIN